MNRAEAIEYLTRCADDNGNHWSSGFAYSADECRTCNGTNDAGWLGTPGSRYGHTSAHCAPVAYEHARILRGGWDVSSADLDHSMSLVVNDHEEPEQDIREHYIALAGANIERIVDGYLDAQLWAQHDYGNEDQTLDENYSRWDITEEYVESVRDEIAALVAQHPLAVRMYLNATGSGHNGRRFQLWNEEQFGHDFYLTREGHGAGFRDRGLGELGDYLTQISKWAGAASDLWDNGDGELSA